MLANETDGATVDEDALYRKVIRRIVPIFFIGFVCSYLDRVNISLAKLPMQRDFGLTEHAFTLGASIFFWGYMVFEVPSNLLLQRVGARAWIARIMITWGLVSMLMIFSRSLPVFYSLRLLLGVCEAGFVPGVLYYANQWLPTRRQSGMFALFLLALPVAEVIGAPLSGFLIEHTNGVGGLHGWQWLFLLEGAPTVVLGGVLFAVLRNRPDQVRWLTPAEQAVVLRNVNHVPHRSHRVLAAFLLPGMYLLIAVMLLFNTSFYGLVFWLPSIVERSGVTSTTTIGLLTAIPFAAGGVSMVVVSHLAERTGRQRLYATASAAAGCLGMAAAWLFAGRLPFALAGLSVAIAGVLSLMPIFSTLPGRMLAGPAAAGGLALINSCGSLSGVLGVWIIRAAGVRGGIGIFALMLLGSAALLYLAAGTDGQTRHELPAAVAEL